MNDLPELVRLKSEFGWSAYELDNESVGQPLKNDKSDISFPSDTWDDDDFNEGGMGVWADIRLKQINAQMTKHGISTIWEVGSGNGAVCLGLAKKGYEVLAIEPLYSGARFTASQGVPSFACTLEELSLPTGSLSAVGAFDVLEHIEDTHPLLTEFARILSSDGLLFITVPAHPFLFSEFDSSIGHFRRYTSRELKASLSKAGFELVHFSHLFAFLVPIAWLVRVLPEKLGSSKKASANADARKQFKIAQMLEPIFRALSAIENILRLPFGLSILAVARPKESQTS
jgi:SAM-dependent methyltransferase